MLIEAMTRTPELVATIDLASGEIDLLPLESTLMEEEVDPGEDRVEIPRIDTPAQYEWMREFAARIDEDDVRQQLEDALDGRGAFGRFRRTIERYPDLAAHWERGRAERVIEDARLWLTSLDIDADLPVPAVVRSSDPPRGPRQAPVGLLDLLLLGAPDGRTEMLEGRTYRVFVAGSPAEARAVFKRAARELCEWHGTAWRNRFIEGRDRYEVDRFLLTIEGTRVDLAVEVSGALWKAFAGR